MQTLSRRHGSGPALPRGHFSGLAKVGLMIAANLPAMHSHPVISSAFKTANDKGEKPGKPSFWIYVGTAIILVLLGGIFAGLTLGLMGQDEIYLQVIEQSGEAHEKKNAAKVLRLLKRGKHWVLVTLLLSNVITNETLPIVLDRSLGGGWPAVLGSTVLIVIFGEIIPQSVCVRYGLGIGAWLSPFVLVLMYIMFPVAYPTALLLDYVLGEDHGTIYKKAGLKTLVTLHKTLGPTPGDRLNQDEVTIISAVLDLKEKPVGSIMTPIKDVYTMSSDAILDESAMHEILSAGYSRIPIHAPGEEHNFVGMLLVKILITYDPEDEKKVGDFPLATLPETRPDTSCLDIVNFFQEGKSHMVLVSDVPGANFGALGVVTLEDVIEELIGEEIIDESDVYVDVHKAIRRANPSPLVFAGRRSISTRYVSKNADPNAIATVASAVSKAAPHDTTDLLITSDTPPDNDQTTTPSRPSQVPSRPSLGAIPNDIMAHLRMGPANLAGNPKETKSKTVMIKNARPSGEISRNSMDIYGTAGDGNTDPPARSPRDLGLHIGTKKVARSGSLIERVEQSGGMSKTIIETTSSDDEDGVIAESPRSSKSSKSGKSRRNGESSPLLSWRKNS